MRALLLDADVIGMIRATVEKARAKPLPQEVLKQAAFPEQGRLYIPLEDRPADHKRPLSERIDIPMGYAMAVSFEEQPAGLVAHFSISVDAPDKLPHQEAVRALISIAGYDLNMTVAHWVEEFLLNDKPGGLAVNLCFLVGQAQQMGTA